MSETAQISEIAEILSNEVFGVFGWETVGPKNHKWPCVEMDRHKKKVHPSDVVFRYRDPYRGVDIYVNTDLKSYAKSSIESANFSSALKSLALSVECANKSDEWQKAYLDARSSHEVIGLLFVYNHDGEFDKDFSANLADATPGKVKAFKTNKIMVMGPDRIAYLNTIAKDILQQRGAKKLPSSEACRFYYPDLENAKVSSQKHGAASIEMLLGPWQIIHFKGSKKGKLGPGYFFYSAGDGSSEEEFMYILDFIFNYQLLGDQDSICIRMPFASNDASPCFERAQRRYADEFWPISDDSRKEFEQRLARITLKKITDIATVFSTTEIGMRIRNV